MIRDVGWLKIIIAMVVCAVAMPVRAQNFGGGAAGFQIDPAQIRSGLLGRVQNQVQFTDEEWSVIEPKLWRVVGLQAQSGSGAVGQLRGLMGRGRGRGGGGGGVNLNDILSQIFNNGRPLPVLQRQQALQDVLDDPNSPDLLVATRLREYRQSVQAVKMQLEQAQRELLAVLTLRQEAMLMEMGYLQ